MEPEYPEDEEPAGFPDCHVCYFYKHGDASTCFRCASKTLEAIDGDHCPVCCQTLAGRGRCGNRLCGDSARHITAIDAVAIYTGELRAKINRFKGDGATAWATVFGRLLLGHIQANYDPNDIDLIIANPTYKTRNPRHTEMMIDAADVEDYHGIWSFDAGAPRVLAKTAETTPSKSSGLAAKIAAADELYEVLELANSDVVHAQHVIVVDDLCTTGYQLDRVAKKLIVDGGAASVRGLVLARVPWSG
jgi:predicted amidophosphoribosyltransferase